MSDPQSLPTLSGTVAAESVPLERGTEIGTETDAGLGDKFTMIEQSGAPASKSQAESGETRAEPAVPLRRLQRRLQTLAHLLHRVHLLFSSPSSTDRVLCTASYALKLIAAFLSTAVSRQVASVAASTKMLATTPAKIGSLLSSAESAVVLDPRWVKASEWAGRMGKLEGLISDYRVFVRLWGFVGIVEWVVGHWRSGLALSQARKDGSTKSILTTLTPSGDPFTRQLVWTQIAVNIAYQALENGAYLAQHNIISWPADRQQKAWLWSARCWASHVALDFARLWREAALTRKREAYYSQRDKRLMDSDIGDEKSEEPKSKLKLTSDEVEAAGADAAGKWYRSLVANFAYAPLTVHCSLQDGLIGNVWVGVFGLVAGGVSLADSWKKTA